MENLNYNSSFLNSRQNIRKMIGGLDDLILITIGGSKLGKGAYKKLIKENDSYTGTILNEKTSPKTGRVNDIFCSAYGAHKSKINFHEDRNTSTTFIYERKNKRFLGSIFLISNGEEYSSEVVISSKRINEIEKPSRLFLTYK